MTVETFFDLFLKELKESPAMTSYYKFLSDEKSFGFRKAYFIQRLQYVINQIENKEHTVFDCGCGYGTTCLFLAMNGIKSFGTTLEFYFDRINERKKYWGQFGDTDLFQIDYSDLFDRKIEEKRFHYIVIQDTLHHLEPIGEAVEILSNVLDDEGKLIVIEENGRNVIQCAKLFLQRGNKRIITMWDERLQKNILLGNENIRSLEEWGRVLAKSHLEIDQPSINFIRYKYPASYANASIESIVGQEQRTAQKYPFLRNYFFFGINFVAKKRV
ncbi:class I SAM-dependent methyltransferase [Bacteroidales bacterium OttesenSCG-928-B11]|nr:class I SAM-dependent methyltransferase [Bacteroidales bacterium OttesenSCG-928-C03]MDL2312730.1 class I SAM-dependent methyltransferase [Bacteroidales bacterium OttesenSCG-928-B11]